MSNEVGMYIDALIAQTGLSQSDVARAINVSRHRLSSKNIVAMLLAGKYMQDNNFPALEPRYDVTKEQIRDYLLQMLKEQK